MSLGMLIIIAFAVIVGVMAMRLAWRVVAKVADERPLDKDR
jgi:predicted tellurium resistance membrane protein TerC